MKKCFYLACALLCATAFQASAGPGDTTWVQANNRKLDNGNGYGPYDTTVAFPAGATTYRKIYMIFTLGEYACPAGSQYCHQWDYTVTNFLMTPGGDTLELSRLITPYANTGVPRFPATWSKDYAFDVTDYAGYLQGSGISRIFYSGYSAGFTANVRFAFIEGVPERTVMGVSQLWNGSYLYGKAADPIDNHITQKSLTAPASTQSAELKFTVTGHGSDNNQCCEFVPHNYMVKLNGATTDTKLIWKDDCGLNQVYPQGGTWIYDRANWCPGELINVNTHKLNGIAAGNNYTLDVDFDGYTAGNTDYGSYTTNGAVVYYGAYNHTTDASIEDIISPSSKDEHYRDNPGGSKPVIRVRNNGSAAITSMVISYGVKDSAMAQYTWTGSLAPSTATELTLPALNTLSNMSLSGNSGAYTFVTNIVSVNGSADQDITNDRLTSPFVVAPSWPANLVISMKTNNEGTGGLGSGTSETSWKITDMNDNIVASRTDAALSTTYADTIALRQQGFYKLTITDDGCDGLHWWVWDANPSAGVTAGTFTVRKVGTTATIPMKGYSYSGTYANDFGCGFTQYFTTVGWPTGIQQVNGAAAAMELYPNPAGNSLSVTIEGISNTRGQLMLTDLTGRTTLQQAYDAATRTMDVSKVAAGVYMLAYRNDADPGTTIIKKVVITH